MRMAKYFGVDGKPFEVEYDENASCIICGEPVISASMGGTVVCPACDCGKCRYCGMAVMVFKKEVDGGKSKEALLKHMEWHKKNTPVLVKEINDAHREMNERFDELKKAKR